MKKKIIPLLLSFVVFSGFTNDNVEQTLQEVNDYFGVDDEFKKVETTDLNYEYPYTYYTNDYAFIDLYPDFEKAERIQFYSMVNKDDVLKVLDHFNIDLTHDDELMKMFSVGGCYIHYFKVIDGVGLRLSQTGSYTWASEDEPEYNISIEFNQPKFQYIQQSIDLDLQRMGCSI